MSNRKLSTALAGLLAKLPSAQSRRGYEGDWNRYLKWLKRQKLDVRKVRPRDVESYLTRLQAEGKKLATIGRAYATGCRIYDVFMEAKLVVSNPFRKVERPKVQQEPRADRIAVRLDDDMPAWLEREAQAKKQPQSTIIRALIREAMTERLITARR